MGRRGITFKNEQAYISSLGSDIFKLYMLPWWGGGGDTWVLLLSWKSLSCSVRAEEEL